MAKPEGLKWGAQAHVTPGKDQGRKEGLNVELKDTNNPLPHTEVRSGHKECSSVLSEDYTPRQGPERIPIQAGLSYLVFLVRKWPEVCEKAHPTSPKAAKDTSLDFSVAGVARFPETREHL